MLTTAELRWFYPGKLPQAVIHWFNNEQLGKHLAPTEEREDTYLYVPESDFVGIKLRQGRLEIKWRKAELDNLEFGKVTGKAEKWAKWLCEDASNESFQPQVVIGKKAWVSIQKVRTQRKYQVSLEQTVVAIPINDSSDRICSVELTQLKIHNDLWWSLAFEASGNELTDTLKIVAEWVLQFYCEPTLSLPDSYAYPIWLAKTSISQQM